MFRTRQKLNPCRSVRAVQMTSIADETGKCHSEQKDIYTVLPDASLFELKIQLEAGVDLQQVNSKLLDGKNAIRYQIDAPETSTLNSKEN